MNSRKRLTLLFHILGYAIAGLFASPQPVAEPDALITAAAVLPHQAFGARSFFSPKEEPDFFEKPRKVFKRAGETCAYINANTSESPDYPRFSRSLNCLTPADLFVCPVQIFPLPAARRTIAGGIPTSGLPTVAQTRNIALMLRAVWTTFRQPPALVAVSQISKFLNGKHGLCAP